MDQLVHCQACGHPTSDDDPPMRITEGDLTGTITHLSHTTDPTSGLYQWPVQPA